ncbi:hypothetical protein EBZ39_15545 [bacterium]|nr:hypothetical protein [bacterium]
MGGQTDMNQIVTRKSLTPLDSIKTDMTTLTKTQRERQNSLNMTPTLMTADKAEKFAQELSEFDEDGWTYKVVPSGNRAMIATYDEGGFIGYL